jgi:hypothetical protein
MGIANTDPSALSWGWWDNESNPHYSVGGTLGYTSTGSRMWLNTDGVLQTTGSMRAPIFYDSADTTYYGDFAGTSWLRHLSVGDVNASNDGGWNARLNLTGSSHARLDVKSNSDGIITTMYSHTGQGVGRVGTWSNHPLAFMVNGGIAGYAYANYLQGVDSVRAPIFYDSNDTAYYLDPNAGTSLKIAGGIVTTAESGSVLLKHERSEANAWIFRENAANWGLFWFNEGGQSGQSIGSYTTVGAELFGMNNAVTGYNPNSAWSGTDASTRAAWMLSNYGGYLWTQGTQYSETDMRAPIFYDSNNTNRYLDLNSTAADAMVISGGIHISRDNVTGNGIILADDGDIVDLNDAYCSMRFSYGVRIFSANRGGSPVHTLHSDGNAYFNTSAQTPTFLVNSHSDNTKGYRIYNTSNSSVSAMFTNSANALVIGAGAFDQVQLNKKVLVSGAALGVNVAASATAGRIDASNDIVAYSSSDERLKENITPIENALDKVKSLTGVEFDWKPEYKHAHGYEGHDTGIIAQQVQEVIPSAVRTNDTGFLAVRYEKLIGLLIEANKELAARVEELEKKLG